MLRNPRVKRFGRLFRIFPLEIHAVGRLFGVSHIGVLQKGKSYGGFRLIGPLIPPPAYERSQEERESTKRLKFFCYPFWPKPRLKVMAARK